MRTKSRKIIVHRTPVLFVALHTAAWALVAVAYSQTPISTASASTVASIGYVEQLEGDIDGIRIERNGKSLSPAVLLPLQTGDRLLALNRDSAISVLIGNRRVVITTKESPYLVPPVDQPPGFLTRLQSTLISVGAKLTSQYVRASVPVSTSSRGHEGPLSLPLIEDELSKVGAERTLLHVAWEGGAPPFVVRLMTRGIEAAVRRDVADTWRTSLPIPRDGNSPGIIQIVVEDSAGDRVQKSIAVVPTTALPPLPAVLREDGLPPTLKTLLIADALLLSNRRTWGLEAYQELAPLAESYEPARLFRDCLETAPSCDQR